MWEKLKKPLAIWCQLRVRGKSKTATQRRLGEPNAETSLWVCKTSFPILVILCPAPLTHETEAGNWNHSPGQRDTKEYTELCFGSTHKAVTQ